MATLSFYFFSWAIALAHRIVLCEEAMRGEQNMKKLANSNLFFSVSSIDIRCIVALVFAQDFVYSFISHLHSLTYLRLPSFYFLAISFSLSTTII